MSPLERTALIGRVLRSDPPLNVPGNEEIVLDPEGRLVSFAAVPPQFDPDPGPWKDVDWSAALSDAGLDPARLRPSTPHWAAPVDSDRKAAWDGAYPDQSDVPIHVEAAAYHGRPVHFAVRGPWEPAAPAPSSDPERGRMRMILSFALCYPGMAIAVFLVRRNLRLGRGDRRGAVRLATFSFVTFTIAQILEADHTSRTTVEYHLLHLILGYSLFWAFACWLTYLAIEPAMRRRWPQALISWSRLLSGRSLDPLVGRDVLLGALAGLAMLVPFQLAIVASAWFGSPPLVLDKLLSSLSAPRHEAYLLFLAPLFAVVLGLGGLYLLFLLETLLKRVWLARLLVVLGVVVLQIAGSADSFVALVLGAFGILQAGIVIAVSVRLGLLSAVTLWFTFYLLGGTPLTLDWSAWYAGRSFVILALLVCLFAAAFYTSLGGKPIFGRALLED